MFLTMALIVAISSCFIEAKLVNAIPFLERIYTQGIFGIPGAWVNNICSLGISAVFGMVFQAQGIAIFVGGMLSIPMSNIYFGAKYKLNSRGVTMESLKEDYSERTSAGAAWVEENGHYIRDFIQTCWILLKVIGWPLRAILRANSRMIEAKKKMDATLQVTRQKVDALKRA